MACPPWGREAESLLLLLLVCGDRRVTLGALSVPQGVSCHPFHPHPPSGLLIPLKKKTGLENIKSCTYVFPLLACPGTGAKSGFMLRPSVSFLWPM